MLINGQPSDQIPITDRGLHYGDGLFETIAVIDSSPRLWDRHMARLSRGEAALGLPPSDKAQLRREAGSLCEGSSRGVLKLIITRGSGGRGYRPPENAETRRILSLQPWPDYPARWYRDGIRLRLCETRWSRNPRLAGVKHLNRLEQVLARQEWRDPQIAEGLMLDEQDAVISVTQGNLFLISDGRLYTPDLSHSGIAGILRGLVIECAQRLNIPLEIAALDLAQVRAADALFVTNALLGLCPVVALEEQRFDPQGIPATLRRAVADAMKCRM
ncbi:MAG: aminodeoxychorismate lyase [Candidatus Thiodiazotropha sp.]